MMKVGVSGASGQLGSAVVRALVETVAPEDLVAISRTPKTNLAYAGRLGDYDQPETLVVAYQGLDRLLLIPGPDLRPGIRSRQMLAALDAAARPRSVRSSCCRQRERNVRRSQPLARRIGTVSRR